MGLDLPEDLKVHLAKELVKLTEKNPAVLQSSLNCTATLAFRRSTRITDLGHIQALLHLLEHAMPIFLHGRSVGSTLEVILSQRHCVRYQNLGN